MSNWSEDKGWSDRFIAQIKRVVADRLTVEAPADEDQKRATDLVLLDMRNIRIACRVRRPGYLRPPYDEEFTIRCTRQSGASTEFEKLVAGAFADYLFYGFSDPEERRVCRWFIGNLAVFRACVWRWLTDGPRTPLRVKHNTDGQTEFYAIRLVDMPREFIVAWDGYPPAMFQRMR